MKPVADEWLQLEMNLSRVTRQAEHLRTSLKRVCEPRALEEVDRLERFEALTARFSRLQDGMLAPFRSVAFIELEDRKTERIPDLLNLMEKRGIIRASDDWGIMRRIRNAIAHEYWENADELEELHQSVIEYSKILLESVVSLHGYIAAMKSH